MRRWLIVLHRYLGIGLGGLFVLWFASGIVMLYAGDMPNLAPDLRLLRAAPVDLTRVVLTAAEASRRATLPRPPATTTLVTILDRPAYRFTSGQTTRTVFADTGEVLTKLTVEQCRVLASRFARVSVADVEYVATLTRPDQWTLVDRRMPVHKFRLGDELGTELYVAPELGEVTVMTTRRARLLAWLGAIPHWLYIPSLRLHRELWYQLIVWTSALGCVMTALGLLIGLLQVRRRTASGRRAWIPYAGWMRWHHLTGLAFGVFALTWVFSGLLSMEPFAWTRATGLAIGRSDFAGGPPDLAAFPPFDPARWPTDLGGAVKAIEFVRVLGRPQYLVATVREPDDGVAAERVVRSANAAQSVVERWLVDPDSLSVRRELFDPSALLARLSAVAPSAPIVEVDWLRNYDAYYYARYGRVPPLPVLRVKLADPAASWLYLDPRLGTVAAVVSRSQRLERWLYHGLHSLDVVLPYESRGRRVLAIVLSLGGLVTSGVGCWLGWTRLVRSILRPRSGR